MGLLVKCLWWIRRIAAASSHMPGIKKRNGAVNSAKSASRWSWPLHKCTRYLSLAWSSDWAEALGKSGWSIVPIYMVPMTYDIRKNCWISLLIQSFKLPYSASSYTSGVWKWGCHILISPWCWLGALVKICTMYGSTSAKKPRVLDDCWQQVFCSHKKPPNHSSGCHNQAWTLAWPRSRSTTLSIVYMYFIGPATLSNLWYLPTLNTQRQTYGQPDTLE